MFGQIEGHHSAALKLKLKKDEWHACTKSQYEVCTVPKTQFQGIQFVIMQKWNECLNINIMC